MEREEGDEEDERDKGVFKMAKVTKLIPPHSYSPVTHAYPSRLQPLSLMTHVYMADAEVPLAYSHITHTYRPTTCLHPYPPFLEARKCLANLLFQTHFLSPKKEFLELWRGIFLDAENVIKYVDGNKSLRSLGKDLGGSRGLVIIDDDSCLRDCVFEPSAVYWLDLTLFLIDLL